jgi:hypothetical protein
VRYNIYDRRAETELQGCYFLLTVGKLDTLKHNPKNAAIVAKIIKDGSFNKPGLNVDGLGVHSYKPIGFGGRVYNGFIPMQEIISFMKKMGLVFHKAFEGENFVKVVSA